MATGAGSMPPLVPRCSLGTWGHPGTAQLGNTAPGCNVLPKLKKPTSAGVSEWRSPASASLRCKEQGKRFGVALHHALACRTASRRPSGSPPSPPTSLLAAGPRAPAEGIGELCFKAALSGIFQAASAARASPVGSRPPPLSRAAAPQSGDFIVAAINCAD